MAKIDVGRSIRGSLGILKNNPIVLAPIIAAAILTTAFNHYLHASGFYDAPGFTTGILVSFLVVSLVSLFMTCVLIRMVYDATQGKPSIRRAARAAAGRYGPVFVAAVLYGLIVIAGSIALIIPGVFLGVKLIFYICAILIEDASLTGSLNRSWRLVKGNWWSTFGFMLCFMLPAGLLSWISGFTAVPAALIVEFAGSLILDWFFAALTVAYLQLTGPPPTPAHSEPDLSGLRMT